jgi:hypothetical protein
LDLYAGRDVEAMRRIEREFADHERSQLLRIESIRINVGYIRTACALAGARHRGDGARAEAERIGQQLSRAAAHSAKPFGALALSILSHALLVPFF